MSGFFPNAGWIVVGIVLVEAMRSTALRFPRARRVSRHFRMAAILLAATIAVELLETLLPVLSAPRAISLALLAGDIAVELSAIGCVVVGTALLMAGPRLPRSPWRRHVSRGGAGEATQPVAMSPMQYQRPGRRSEQGQVTLLVVGLVVAFFPLAGLVIDGGRAYDTRIRAISEAQEAARSGAQALSQRSLYGGGADLNPADAEAVARAYVAAAGDRCTVTITGNTVQVTVTAVASTSLLRAVGIDSLTLTGTGSAQADRSA